VTSAFGLPGRGASATLAQVLIAATEVWVDTNGVLLTVLLVLASVLCVVSVWTVVQAGRTSRSLKTLADDLDSRVVPLLEKADITVDALNAELLRVDGIVSRIEEITDRVESTSRTVQGVANAPAEIVTDIADRVRRAWKRRQNDTAPYAEDADATEDSQQPSASAPDDATDASST
jgi:hypothetical protein